jgi:ribosomal protein S18 acetylase RimI-like enzyme
MDLTVNSNLPPVLNFRPMKLYDQYEVQNLHARRVGTGLENTLELVFNEDSGAHGIVATEGETVVGYGIVLLLNHAGAESYFQFGTQEYPIGETNAVMHALAVDEAWQGRGIGSELMRLRLAIARDVVDLDVALGNAWLRPHTVDVSVLFEKHGFDRYEVVEESFRQSDGTRDCPDCRPDSCRCSSAVYGKIFGQKMPTTTTENT